MPGWTDILLAAELAAQSGLPITVLNDADADAFGEARLGAGQASGNMMFVTVSTGVGAGIVLDGRLLQAESGLHAEFGLLRVEENQTTEDVAGGRALERWTREHGGTGGAARLIMWAQGGNAAAAERLERAVSALVRGFGEARVLTGLEDVVIGGSVGLNPEFYRRLRASAETQQGRSRVHLRPALLGAEAGLIGAAEYVEQLLREHG